MSLTPTDDAAVQAALGALEALQTPQALSPKEKPDVGADDPEADAEAPRDAVPTDSDLTSTPSVSIAGLDLDDDDEEVEEEVETIAEPDEDLSDDDETVDSASPDQSDDEVEEESAGPPPADSSSPHISVDEAWQRLTGKGFTPDEAAGFLRIASDLTSASPQQQAAVLAILEGRDPSQVLGGALATTSAPSAPGVGAPPAFEPIPVPEYADDEQRAIIEQTNARMEAMQAQQTQMAQQYQAMRAQQVQAEMDAHQSQVYDAALRARDRFMSENKVDPTDMLVLQTKAATSPFFDHYIRQHQGNYEAAAYDTFRHVMADTPEVAKRVAANQSTATNKKARKDAERKSKAGKVAAAAAAPPRKPRGQGNRDKDFMAAIERVWPSGS